MAVRGLALEAEQGARALACQLNHLCALGDRLRQLELAGIDARHVLVPPRPCCGAALGRSAEGPQMDIFDPSFFEGSPKGRLRKARAPRKRQRANVNDPP